MNELIKIMDLILPFKEWYEELKDKYEEQIGACITYEAWNDYLEQSFGKDLASWVSALTLAANFENEEKDDDKSEGKVEEHEFPDIIPLSTSQFVEDSEIIYGIDSSPVRLSKSGLTRNLSPCCIPSFWVDSSKKIIGESIIKLIACFNEGEKERRIFNEVHCYSGDATITIGMGHFAAENVGKFFREMSDDVWKEMRSCIKECINQNKNIHTKKKNTNIYLDYKEQFWTDYNKVVKGKKQSDLSADVGDDELDDFFIKTESDKKKNQIRDRCDAAYNEIMNNKNLIWGEDNVLNNNLLLCRLAMKDTYVTKACRFYECVRNIRPDAGELEDLKKQLDNLEDNMIVVDGGDLGFHTLADLRHVLLNTNAKEAEENKLYEQYLTFFNSCMNIFNTKLKNFGSDLSMFYKKYKNIYYEFLKGDIVDIKKTYKELKSYLQPFPGNTEYSGYWFYDIMKVALRLRSVCYYQLYFWIKDVLVLKNDNDAANAAASSWNSSGQKRYLSKPAYLNSFLTPNFSKEDVEFKKEVGRSNASKAFMYWHNYNALRAQYKEKKDIIRGRQEQIWILWFQEHFGKMNKSICKTEFKEDYSFKSNNIKNNIKKEYQSFCDFLIDKEPSLKDCNL